VVWDSGQTSLADPQPEVCHGRGELETALQRQAERELTSQLEEVIANGDRVVVGVRIRGQMPSGCGRPRTVNYDAFTVRHGRVVAIRACRDRHEALAIRRHRLAPVFHDAF
jgi:ketosteroid isomerase-like protein